MSITICLRQIKFIKMCQCSEMSKSGKSETWQPYEEIITRQKENFAVIILNTPINFSFNPHFVINLWNAAKVRLTVDGGTNRWLSWLRMNEREFNRVEPPDLITGDMDSLPPEVLEYFERKHEHVKVIHTPDQNETDFTKALRELKLYMNSKSLPVENIFVFADTCGRFDQIMGNINTIFKCTNIIGNIRLYQIASTSLTWLLRPGHHIINIPPILRNDREWCALIPIGAACTVTTQGLKWNLDNRKLEFGGLVSTSNTYDGSPEVKVQTDGPVIWSMGIEYLLLGII